MEPRQRVAPRKRPPELENRRFSIDFPSETGVFALRTGLFSALEALEVCYTSILRSGYGRAELLGRSAGVYVGCEAASDWRGELCGSLSDFRARYWRGEETYGRRFHRRIHDNTHISQIYIYRYLYIDICIYRYIYIDTSRHLYPYWPHIRTGAGRPAEVSPPRAARPPSWRAA